MTATVEFVKRSFDYFNELCFEGVLPEVPIVLVKARTFLGKMEYRRKRDFFGNIISNYDYRLKISTSFDLPQAELEDIVIHEMIHYYIAYRNIPDSSVHGQTFRRIMQAINTKYSRHITVRHISLPGQKGTGVTQGTSAEYRKHYICVSTFPDGKHGLTVCASTKIFELYRLLPRYYKITKMQWYASIDPFFNRFPCSRTPKIYKITEEDLSEHLKDSIRFRCDGRVLEPAD